LWKNVFEFNSMNGPAKYGPSKTKGYYDITVKECTTNVNDKGSCKESESAVYNWNGETYLKKK
jgi:hypothetical protein